MSNYVPYTVYKDSGVEWIGQVPEHWQVMAIKYIVATPITDGPHETPEFFDDGVPFVSAEAVSSGKIIFDKIRGFISRADHERYSQKYLPKRGDIFMIKSGATTGVTAIVETDAEFNIWSPLAVIRCNEISNPYFVLNFMRSRSFQEAIALSWNYGTQQNIGMGVIGDLSVTVPPIEEQQSIVTHLKHETTRIDALVEKKVRFIELLREKRQALITHAIIKGLDPKVKMKDSCVEWLGEVPEHWVVSRLRHNIDGPLSYGANEAAESDEPDDPRFIRITDLNEDGTLREDTFKSLPHDVAQPYLLGDGDVLLARSGATVGKSFIYRESMGPACYAGYLIRARLLPSKLISQYFWLCTQSTYYWDFISGSNIQATIQNVSGEKYSNLWLAVPPVNEQQRIVEFLEGACTRFESLRVKTERSIALLKERRSALITAAVTGQIDLRKPAGVRAAA